MAEDYCDLCDLPLSTCIHGMPPPPPPPPPAPRTPRSPRATATRKPSTARVTASKPPAVRVRTEQETFRPYIVRLLKEEGALETAEVMEQLAERMDDVLLDRDKQKSPTGEVRWQTVARSERKAMMDEGLIVPAQPGIWQLTDRGNSLPD